MTDKKTAEQLEVEAQQITDDFYSYARKVKEEISIFESTSIRKAGRVVELLGLFIRTSDSKFLYEAGEKLGELVLDCDKFQELRKGQVLDDFKSRHDIG